MSKAFTREDDDPPEEPVFARPNPALPLGASNFVTADGVKRFQDELTLLQEQRTRLNGTPAWSRAMKQRLVDLEYLLRTVEVVEPTGDPCNEVRFGTKVTVREKDGNEQTYRIVGLDETDVDRGWVCWLSPIAKALIGSRVGERVRFRFPVGEKELTIIKIS